MTGIYKYRIGEFGRQRELDDLYAIKSSLILLVDTVDALCKAEEHDELKDGYANDLWTVYELLSERVQYLGSLVDNEKINVVLEAISGRGHREILSNCREIKVLIKEVLSDENLKNIDAHITLVETMENEEYIFRKMINAVYFTKPTHKADIKYDAKTGEMILDGKMAKLAEPSSIQGILLGQAIKKDGKGIKRATLEDIVSEKCTTIVYDQMKFDPTKSFSAATKAINKKAEEEFNISFDILKYKLGELRLADGVRLKK